MQVGLGYREDWDTLRIGTQGGLELPTIDLHKINSFCRPKASFTPEIFPNHLCSTDDGHPFALKKDFIIVK